MNMIVIKCVQISVGMALFYLLYLLLLKNETFYKTNRFFLLGGLIVSILLPLFPISFVSQMAIMNNSEFFSLGESPEMLPVETNTNLQVQNGIRFPWWNMLLWVYLAGLTLFLVRLVWQTLVIFWNIRGAEYKTIDGVKVIDLKTTTPHSFFNVVFVDIKTYSDSELSNIIAHEKVHISERHWVDLLIIELLAVLLWVNPVVWLYERAIKQNHEYLADQGVLLAGYSPSQYQALLINQLMGVRVLGFAHHLNFALNKNRMEMMKKEKSPGASKMKLLLTLPVIVLLVFAFAKKEYVAVNEIQTTASALMTNASENVRVEGIVKAKDGLPLAGANVIQKGTNNGTVTDENGKFHLETPEEFSLVVSYVGYKTLSQDYVSKNSADADVIITLEKGVIHYDLNSINPNQETVMGYWASNEESNALAPKEESVFTIIEKVPVYKNGRMNELVKDLQKETRVTMNETQDRGTTTIGFVVLANGSLENVHVFVSSGSKVLDKSAVTIISNLVDWEPGIQNGKKVQADLTVTVSFE